MPEVVGLAVLAAIPALEGVTVAGIAASTLIGSVVVTGAAFGAEMLLNHPHQQQSGFKAPPGPVAFEPEAQAVAPRFYSYGRVRLGGVYVFREADATKLGYGLVLNCRPIDGIEAWYVDDELLSLVTGPVAHSTLAGPTYGIATFDEGPTVYWPQSGLKWTAFYSYVWSNGQAVPYVTGYGPVGFIELANATAAGTASVELQRYFGASSPSGLAGNTLWTSAHLCRGLTMLYSTWTNVAVTNRIGVYPRLYPTHSTVFRGQRVFDPRDGTQSFLDPGTGQYSVYNPTWKYSSNPALVLADFLTFPEGFGLQYTDIDWNSIIQAANDCDRVVGTYSGGVEPFAQAHLTWSADEERRDVLNRILAACDGSIYENNNGQVTLWIGKWELPSFTFTEADISAFSAEQLNGVYADANFVTPSYVEPRTNFTKNTALYYQDDASVAAVGQRKTTMDFSAVESFNQAYRLAARALRRKNAPLKLTVTGGPRLLLADGQRVVGIDMPTYGISGTFRVMAMEVSSLTSVSLTLNLVTSDMYADLIPPFDPVNASLPGIAYVASFTPIQPLAPNVTSVVAGTNAYLVGSITAPNAMPQSPYVPAYEYADTSSIAKFQGRPVNTVSHAPLGDWVIWSTYIGQYAANSPNITGTVGVAQCYEIQSWLVSPSNTPGPLSPSTFVTISF